MIGTIHPPPAYLQEFGTVHATNIRGLFQNRNSFSGILADKILKMEQESINDRLKFLVNSLSESARAFSDAIGESPTNTHNYTSGDTRPKPEYLKKVLLQFRNVNAYWLMTGVGEPFTTDSPTATTHIKKMTGGAVNSGTGDQHVTLEACQRELEAVKRDAASYQREIELLKGQLESKDALIAAKDEMLNFLRGGYNRPN